MPVVVAVVLAVLVLGALAWRPLLAFLHAGSIGAQALAAQPDAITLEASPGGDWRDPEGRDRVTRELEALGFVPAGTYVVRELPPVRLRLLVHEGEAARAIQYEHRSAGAWFEFAFRSAEGGSVTVTSLAPHGLDDRPGHRVVNVPGATVARLWERARREKPASPLVPARVATIVREFEAAYAESIAQRKRDGLSRAEVVRAATRRRAA